MTRPLPDWQAVYSPFIGKRLDQVAFMPLAGADTPDVVRALEEPVLFYSGAVLLGFEEGLDLFLTWAQTAPADFSLWPYRLPSEDWSRFSLDQIRMSQEEPWGSLQKGRLTKVEVFAAKGVEGMHDLAAAHHFTCEHDAKTLWVSTASGRNPGSGDDLIVAIDASLEFFGPASKKVTVQ